MKVICISGTRCSKNLSNGSLYKISNCKSIHQTRDNGKTDGGVAMFVHNVVYSLSRFLSVNIGNIEALCIEFVNKKDKNIVINGHYGQNAGIYSEFEKYFKGLINETKNNAKDIYILDYIMN